MPRNNAAIRPLPASLSYPVNFVWPVDLHVGAQVHAELARGACALTLGVHRGLEARLVDGEAALARDVARQIQREAESVVEAEHGLARNLLAGELVDGAVEQRHALRQRLGEPLLLLPQHALDVRALRAQFGIRRAHFLVEHRHQRMEERLALAEHEAVADRAADDPAQHVTAPLVRRQHAIGDQERARADVIRDDAQRARLRVLRARELRRRKDQVAEQVDVVVAVHTLHHRCDTLEAHARIHRGLRQRDHLAVGRAVVLHEDEIPDLDVAVAVLVRRARRATLDAWAVVVEDLGAGAAGPGVTHRPEIRFRAHAREAARVDADLLQPDLGGAVVFLEHRHPEALGRDPERARDEIPCVADRLALEVVAEAEVAEHLEERVVARGVADVLEVVVLAAGAHAAL